MRPLPLAILTLSGLTAACASNGPDAPAPVVAAASSAPAPTPGYDWHLTPTDGAVLLAYGVAESDDLRLGLNCDLGSGRVDLTAPGKTGEREIHLESGGETERFPAEGEPTELHDGDLLSAQAATSEPVLQRFRRVGWMAQWSDGRREVYVPHPGSEGAVERFFALCG
ncbi:MAG: hypothetical protein KKA16_09975 [Alphaproteobacteria bacterium]|nr:hypothetical protein [Alphaproteobacteria bacterium]MBU2377859.1 hypothetical protein [Alphaproteobacteria bacterium]